MKCQQWYQATIRKNEDARVGRIDIPFIVGFDIAKMAGFFESDSRMALSTCFRCQLILSDEKDYKTVPSTYKIK